MIIKFVALAAIIASLLAIYIIVVELFYELTPYKYKEKIKNVKDKCLRRNNVQS